MSENTLNVRLKHAAKTEAEWKASNPVLLKGEIAYSTDKRQQKTGDGAGHWADLKYDSAVPTSHSHDLSTMINKLATAAATPTDEDYYVSQYVGGGTTTTSYYRRPMSALWSYIKGKLKTVATTGSYNDLSNKPGTGTASTAGLTKLYTGTGTASDGSMTQAAIKSALDGKAKSDHTHSNVTVNKPGLMSSNDYIDFQSMLEEIKALKKIKDFDGGGANTSTYVDELDGGGAGTSYLLEQTDFVVTLAANKWVQNGSMFTQSITNSKVSGLNDYLIGSTLTGSESQSVTTSYNTNFAYITTGSSSGSTLTINALKKPAIDLSVRVIKI